MADEEKKEGQEEEKKGSSKLVLIIIGVLLVLILVIGGVVAMLLLSDDGSQQSPQAQSAQNSGNTQSVSADDLRVGPMFPLETFTVNLLSDSGRRYLKTELNLEMSTPNLQAELNSKMPIIRDTVIGVLSSKTVEEISTRRGKERLKEEIIEQVNTRLQDGYIKRLYFMMFIVQ
ncbi:MAG: flagellar basal body-associated protein FliL [Campylobacterota bacterium]